MSNNSSSLNSSSVNELYNTVITDSKIDSNVMAVIENLPNSINYTLYLKSPVPLKIILERFILL